MKKADRHIKNKADSHPIMPWLKSLEDKYLQALMRNPKQHAIFRHPYATIALRQEADRRGIVRRFGEVHSR